MDSGIINNQSYLDQIRIHEGADKCEAALKEAYRKNANGAVALLNDSRLSFPCLFILRSQIQALGIQRNLNYRCKAAIRITQQVSKPGVSGQDYLSAKSSQIQSVLYWMFTTGAAEDITDDNYDETVDVTASVLVNRYQDLRILPLMVDLVFRRNRNGRYIHDLVWVLFQSRDPQALKFIAARIQSLTLEDAELAATLLNTGETDIPTHNTVDNHDAYLQWLEENDPYLYFTGESFQFTSKPAFCAIDHERKYLQKGTPSYDWQPVALFDDVESQTLVAFRQLEDWQQSALSAYSHKLHGTNIAAWQEWIHRPFSEQLKVATPGSEGTV